MSKTYSAGIVTAYGAAKRAGYQGTYEDFCRQQAGYAESAAAVETAKNTAVSAASTATTKAGEATTAATAAQTAKTQTEAVASQALSAISSARSSAISAIQTEGATQTANATAQAQAAATSATTASTKASEASASATSAGQSATNAAASATSAAQSASDAQDVLDSIPADYSEMSADVASLKADLDEIGVYKKAIYVSSGSSHSSANDQLVVPVLDGDTIYISVNTSDNSNVSCQLFSVSNGISESFASLKTDIGRTKFVVDKDISAFGLYVGTQSENRTFTLIVESENSIRLINENLISTQYDLELVENAQPGNLLDGVSWEAGSIDGATGTTMASTTRLMTTDYIVLPENSVVSFSIESGYKYVVDWFDENGNVVNINNHATWQTGDSTYSSFGSATKIKLLIADTNNGNVDLSYASKLTATVSFGIVIAFNNISNASTLTTDKYDFGFELGTLNPGTGIGSPSTTRIRSDYIRLGIGSVITTSSPNQNTLIVYEYDVDKIYKSDSLWEDGNRYVVQNDGFVRILLRKNSSNATISSSDIETISGTLSVLRVIPQEIIQKVDSDVSIKDVEAFALRKYTNNARHVSSNSSTPLAILHFSDLHGDVSALTRIINDADAIGVQIDEKICTGDIVANTYTQIASWWDASVMTCIGNHDSASYDQSTGYNWTALSMANRDAYYITPFKVNWGVTHTTGKSYYYKDYSAQKVRLIVMDGMLYNDNGADATAQTAWLADLLASAITNNLHVLIAIHAPHGGAVSVECSFSRYGQGTMPTNSDCNTPQVVVDTVATAIGNGLHFIGYLVGHTHQDNIWDAENDGKQLMYCVTCATTEQVQWKNSDQYRGADADAFNIVTIDTANTLVKIVRGGGADIDDHMRTRKAICVDYSTGNVVGEVL